MWLVHDTENYLGLIAVHCGNLRPKVRELLVRRTALSEHNHQIALIPFFVAQAECYSPNDLTLESCIIVNINDTEGSSCKAAPDKLVVLGHVGCAQLAIGRGQRAGRDVRDSRSIQVVAVNQELPCDRETESIQALLDKVLHLPNAIAIAFAEGRNGSKAGGNVLFALDVATEIETSDIDSLFQFIRLVRTCCMS